MYTLTCMYTYEYSIYQCTCIFLLFCFFLTIACFLPSFPITKHIYNAKSKIVKIAQKAKETERERDEKNPGAKAISTNL